MPWAVVLMALTVVLMLAGVLPVRGGGQEAVFRSPVFLFLLILLGASTVACTLRRKLSLRSMGYHLTHASAVLIMIGAMVGAILEKKLDVRLEIGAPPLHVVRMADGSFVDPGFGLAVESFRVDKYPPNLLVLKDGRIISEHRLASGTSVRAGETLFTIENIRQHPAMGADDERDAAQRPFVAELSSAGGETSYLIEGGGRLGAPTERGAYDVVLSRAADRQYEARLVLDTAGEVVYRNLVMNRPVEVAGWRLYLSSYDRQAGRYVVLTLRRDPGNHAAVTGIVGLMIGAALVFFTRRQASS